MAWIFLALFTYLGFAWSWFFFLFVPVCFLLAIGPHLPEVKRVESVRPEPTSELERIKQAVDQRRREAEASGLPQALVDLYKRFSIKSWGSWEKSTASGWTLPDTISRYSSSDSKEGGETINVIVLELRDGNALTLKHVSSFVGLPDGDGATLHKLQVVSEGNVLFELGVHERQSEWSTPDWSPGEVSAFVPGPWVSNVKLIVSELLRREEEREKKSLADAEEREALELKKKFGL